MSKYKQVEWHFSNAYVIKKCGNDENEFYKAFAYYEGQQYALPMIFECFFDAMAFAANQEPMNYLDALKAKKE